VDRLSEAFQYYLLRASCDIAMEKGKCEGFERTKYADGLLPIDHYKKEVDEIVPHKQTYGMGIIEERHSQVWFETLNTISTDAIGKFFRCQ
jgi:ribonucleotide reductase alpha subunit